MDQTIYSIGPPADWIERREVDFAANSRDRDSPFYYPLVDFQTRVRDDAIESYTYTVEKINDTSRLEDASQFLTELADEHQHLCFHRFDIIRSGERLPALHADDIEVYRRETELESHITNRRLTVDLSVDDLRAGDLVEIEKTIIDRVGEHPLRVRHYYENFWLGWTFPVKQQRIRIDNQSSQRLTLQHHRIDGGNVRDEVEQLEPGERFDRSYSDLEPWHIPETTPTWWWPNSLRVSRAQTWPQVSRYLYDFYTGAGAFDNNLDPGDLPHIGLGDDPRDNVIRIVRFVQNEIRYRGRHHGIYTHTPRPPAEVIRRRAGDCKDKSNLLVALLRAIGIDANLALVNGEIGKGIDTLPPSPHLFDHMIVRVRVDAETRYFDATIKKQGGDFDHAAELDYGYALNLTAGGEELARLPYRREEPAFSVDLRLDLRDGGAGRGRLDLRFVYHRGDADLARLRFASTEKSQIADESRESARNNTGFELDIEQPATIVDDDLERNILVVEEAYSLLNLDRTHQRNQIEIDSGLSQRFPLPASADFPLALYANGQMEFHLAVSYPRRPPVIAGKLELSNKHFDFADRIRVDGRTIHFEARMTPHSDCVELSELDDYRREIEKVWERSQFFFPVKVGLNWPLGWLFLLAVVVFGLIMILFTD